MVGSDMRYQLVTRNLLIRLVAAPVTRIKLEVDVGFRIERKPIETIFVRHARFPVHIWVNFIAKRHACLLLSFQTFTYVYCLRKCIHKYIF